MTTLKETNVKYTTKINSNGDKTVNIKSSNGANVTNVYDGHTNEFKYCHDHNSERVKTYQRDGNIYKYYDDDKPKYNGYKQSYHRNYDYYNVDKPKYNRNYDYYDEDKPKYNYNRSYGYHDDSKPRYNGYNRSYNSKRYYN